MEAVKMTLEELKNKAGMISEKELLEKISGGSLDDCHDADGNPLPSKTAGAAV